LANLIKREFTTFGAALARSRRGSPYWTQQFAAGTNWKSLCSFTYTRTISSPSTTPVNPSVRYIYPQQQQQQLPSSPQQQFPQQSIPPGTTIRYWYIPASGNQPARWISAAQPSSSVPSQPPQQQQTQLRPQPQPRPQGQPPPPPSPQQQQRRRRPPTSPQQPPPQQQSEQQQRKTVRYKIILKGDTN